MISTSRRLRAAFFAAAIGASLVACGAESARAQTDRQLAGLAGPHGAAARIVPTKRPLQCVPFARKASGIQIRGDAWTWWSKANGRYARGRTPQVGAVLVMKKTRRLRRGHLAVVKRVVDERVIIVDQANWLNRGRIHLNTAVVDVSRANDWSAVRVWYTPGGRYGARTYSGNGFIYPDAAAIRVAGLNAAPRAPEDRQATGLPAHKANGLRASGADRAPHPPARKPARARQPQPLAHEVMRADWRRG